jgi:hypothetical protein
MDRTFSDSSTVVATKEKLFAELKQEVVILDKKSGEYYGLNSVGATIWHLIQEPKAVKQIRDAILAEFEVEPHQCDSDLQAFLREMHAKGLLEISNETAT